MAGQRSTATESELLVAAEQRERVDGDDFARSMSYQVRAFVPSNSTTTVPARHQIIVKGSYKIEEDGVLYIAADGMLFIHE